MAGGPDLLRRVIVGLRSGTVAPKDAEEFADRLESYLAGARDGLTSDEALGLATALGATPWWIVEARERRDRLIRTFASRYGVHEVDVAAQLRSYEKNTWKNDRRRGGVPEANADSPRTLLYRILCANEALAWGRLPTSDKQIRRIVLNHSAETQFVGHEIPPSHVQSDEGQCTETSAARPIPGIPINAVCEDDQKIAQRRRRGGRRERPQRGRRRA